MINVTSKITTYVKNIPSEIKFAEYPLTKIDLKEVNGIQNNIPLFKGVKIEDIAFITKRLETLNLFRGCRWGCSHCLKNALAPKKGRETILFEDLLRFVEGFSKLSERFGFNVLNGNKYINIVDDSNPIDTKIKGLTKEHTVYEAMKLIYENLNIPTLFVTSGWVSKYVNGHKYAVNIARSIVNMVKKDKNSVKNVEISINPFMDVNNYTDRMAETLFAFLDLFKIDKAKIIYRHGSVNWLEFNQSSLTEKDEAFTKKLYQDIYNKLQKLAHSSLESIPELKPEVVTKFGKSHLIEPSGRGRRFFSSEKNMQLQKELIQDSLDWRANSEEEQREILLNNSLKCVDIDGSIYTTKPSSATYIATPIELTIPTDIKLNYINKNKPNPIFSDIEM